MTDFELAAGQFVMPTPAGAFHAVSMQGTDPVKRLLCALMSKDAAPALELAALRAWTGAASDENALELLHHAQSLDLVQAESTPRAAPSGSLEQLLPSMLVNLSSSGKALIADGQGFYLSSQGFAHETAEELSALSADLAALQVRHRGLLQANLALPTSSWALVDAWGASKLGFWPLHIGEQRFVLVLADRPLFNQGVFVDLAWALTKRYAGVDVASPRNSAPARP